MGKFLYNVICRLRHEETESEQPTTNKNFEAVIRKKIVLGSFPIGFVFLVKKGDSNTDVSFLSLTTGPGTPISS